MTYDTQISSKLDIQMAYESLYWNFDIFTPNGLTIFLSTRSHDGTDSPPNSEDLIVIMDSFKAKIVKIKVSKSNHEKPVL